MKKRRFLIIPLMLTCAVTICLPGCGYSSENGSASYSLQAETQSAETEAADTGDESTTAEESDTSSESTAALNSESVDTADLFSDRDLEQTADTSQAKEITVTDEQDITISEEGVYVISGNAKNVTIRVEAADAKVQLVLNGVSITNVDQPAIYVTDADKVFLTTAEGTENTLQTTGTFTADGDTSLDAVIFSQSDLTLNGQGSLTIESAEGNGISGKDEVTITGGTYAIHSALDAIEAHDSVAICGGNISIDTEKDGIHSEDSDDDTVGLIYISGGTFQINAVDDGVQGTTWTVIDGGTFDISAAEGIESTFIQINGGTISINASDDGINAAAKSTGIETAAEFNGGEITITMASGDTDAIDANGSIYINGGTIQISTSGSSFDYDNTAELNGGTLIINGEEVTEIPVQTMGGMGQMGAGGGRNFGEQTVPGNV